MSQYNYPEERRKYLNDLVKRRNQQPVIYKSNDCLNPLNVDVTTGTQASQESGNSSSSSSQHDTSSQQQQSINPYAVYKAFSRINGAINRMSMDQIQAKLKDAGLESSGSDVSCRKRLKNYFRTEASAKYFNQKKEYNYQVIIVVDFEATCQRDSGPCIIQEIIEFPAFLIDVNQQTVISSFHSYVKPTLNDSKLSQFCTELTGITQDQVDSAQAFPVVLDQFEEWLYQNLQQNHYESFAFATDGYVYYKSCDVHLLTTHH